MQQIIRRNFFTERGSEGKMNVEQKRGCEGRILGKNRMSKEGHGC